MKAFKIDLDGVTELDAEEHEILDPNTCWDCARLDDSHDVWVDDEGLFTCVATVTIGNRDPLPIPAYVLGIHGERVVGATLDIETVRAMIVLNRPRFRMT